MNKLEAAKLLMLASGFDRWMRADDLTSTVWGKALCDVPYKLAEEAVVAHYSGETAHKQLMPADIIKATEHAARLTRGQVEADVRSAKARGLVEKSWPDRQLLPEEVRVRLAAAREVDRAELLALGSPDVISAEEFRRLDASNGREGEAA